jgi:hypothetical protein
MAGVWGRTLRVCATEQMEQDSSPITHNACVTVSFFGCINENALTTPCGSMRRSVPVVHHQKL